MFEKKENDLDIAEEESEMDSIIIVNIQPVNSESPHLPAMPHNLLLEDPPVEIQSEPQLDCLADLLCDERYITSPVVVRGPTHKPF